MYSILISMLMGLTSPGGDSTLTGRISSHQNTVFWAIVNSKGDTSYLLGTFHEFGNSFVDRYPVINKKYKAVDAVVIEAAGDKKNSFRRNPKWTRYLTRRERHDAKFFFKRWRLGYKLKHVKRVPPQFVNYAIWSEVLRERCKVRTPEDVVRMDEYIANGAETFKKRLIGLESAADTFGVINAMMGLRTNNDSSGLGIFREIISNIDRYYPSIDSLCGEVEDYRALNINYKFDTNSVTDDSLYALLLDKRNNAWIPRIEALIDTSHAFIAVGLSHLFYTEGLIMQLRRRGYTVVPIALVRREEYYK